MPGSKVDGRTYEARFNVDIDDIPYLPNELYLSIVTPAAKPLVPVKGNKYSKRQKEQIQTQARWSLWEFRMAQEGSRDNKHYKACLDIGAMIAVGLPKKKVDDYISRIEKYGKANDSDPDTMAKTADHIARGMAEPKIVSGAHIGESWWFSRPALERTYNRAMLRGDSPWATLLTELVFLSASLDHRVLLKPWTDDPATPIALWVAVVAPPGSGKSRVIRRTQKWASGLPKLAKPPPVESARPGSEVVPHDDFSEALAQNPLPRMSDPSTGPGLLRAFMGRIGEGRAAVEAKTLYRLLAAYDEPDTLFRQTSREHNLHSIFRTSYYSGAVDPVIAKTEGYYHLSAMSYSVDFWLAVQPYRMADIRDMSESGTFQRFIFCDSGVDIETVKKMRTERDEYPVEYSEIEKWHPAKKLGGIRKSIVELDPKAQLELEAMDYWARGDSDEHYEDMIPLWRSMAPMGHPHELTGHLDVRLQRLAVMLARHDGMEMDGRRLVVPYAYFADAKEIMAHSADVVRSTIAQDASEQEDREKARVAKTVKTAAKVKEAEEAVEANIQEVYTLARLRAAAGEMAWSTFWNAARQHRAFRGMSPKEAKACIEDMESVELWGSPLILRLREES